jgi:hypothetical protein
MSWSQERSLSLSAAAWSNVSLLERSLLLDGADVTESQSPRSEGRASGMYRRDRTLYARIILVRRRDNIEFHCDGQEDVTSGETLTRVDDCGCGAVRWIRMVVSCRAAV